MKTTTLERPATAKQQPKPQTPIELLQAHARIYPLAASHFPPRERIQREVRSAERQEAEEILANFAEAKELAAVHDIAGLTERILSHETPARNWNPVLAEQLRRQRDLADDDVFQAAQIDLREIRARAMQINLDVLSRALASLEAEIVNIALATEERLISVGLPIFEDIPTAGPAMIAPWSIPGYQRKWTLLSDNVITMLRSRRDCVAWKITCLAKCPGGLDNCQEVAIYSLRFFCTDEAGLGYDWL